MNEAEFLKATKMILDPLFSLDMIDKIDPGIRYCTSPLICGHPSILLFYFLREVASYLAKFAQKYAPEKETSLLAGFLIR